MIPLPQEVRVVEDAPHRAVIDIEGLYPGYGHTIGNALRRVLLSSLEGAVITSVKITGVGHEFSTIDGVLEDVVDIALNLKEVRCRVHVSGPVVMTLAKKGAGAVTGKDFKISSQVEVVNPETHIATLTTKEARLEMEAVVESGLGYVPVEARTKDKVEVGTIALDASFTPVRHVNYEVENMRVGDRTDYNRVRVSIETDGSVTPLEAFQRAVGILIDQFGALTTVVRGSESAEDAYKTAEDVPFNDEQRMTEEREEAPALKVKLEDLRISGRVLKVLADAGIKTVAGILRRREEVLREIDGLGDKGIQEIKKEVGKLGLTLKQ